MMNSSLKYENESAGFTFNTKNLYGNSEKIYLFSKVKCSGKITIDPESFKRIYDLYFYDICRFLNYYSRNMYVIEEIVQDLFTSLWEDRERVRIEYIKTYLYKGARNRMLNYLRDDSNRKMLMGRWAESIYENRDSIDCIDRERFRVTLKAAVALLPEKCKDIFLLSRIQKLSYKEIAQSKNISVKTVENQMGIAFKKIRSYFYAHFEES